jgi:hypothetical protein
MYKIMEYIYIYIVYLTRRLRYSVERCQCRIYKIVGIKLTVTGYFS